MIDGKTLPTTGTASQHMCKCWLISCTVMVMVVVVMMMMMMMMMTMMMNDE